MHIAAEILQRYGIALTGGIGTGKSTVARMLAAKGMPMIDADRLARDVTAAGKPAVAEIAAAFGAEMLTPEGLLDRKRLGQRVFAHPDERKRLEAITHPRIREALVAELDRLGIFKQPRLFVYEASLIFENQLERQFRAVWVTICPEAEQIRRVMLRDGFTEERVRQILAAQMPVADKAKLADLVIDTSVPTERLQAQLDAAVQGI